MAIPVVPILLGAGVAYLIWPRDKDGKGDPSAVQDPDERLDEKPPSEGSVVPKPSPSQVAPLAPSANGEAPSKPAAGSSLLDQMRTAGEGTVTIWEGAYGGAPVSQAVALWIPPDNVTNQVESDRFTDELKGPVGSGMRM